MAATTITPSSASNAFVQAKFFTKLTKYAVPEFPFSVPSNVGCSELSNLINGLLAENQSDHQKTEFDFLINGELLRTSLDQFMEEKKISSESVIEIEYLEKYGAPKPEDSLNHDDWISSVQGCENYILSGCYDNTIHIWNTEGQHILTIPGHTDPVKAVSWIKLDDPISTFVSSSHDQTLIIWDWNVKNNSVECVHVCRGHARSVDCIAVDKTKTKICSGSYDKMLKIWSAVSSPEPVGLIEDITDSATRKKLKTESGQIKTRVPLLTLSGHNEAISSVKWTDTSEVCTVSFDRTIRLWDIELGGLKTTLTGSKVFLSVSHSPLNRLLLTSSVDRHIRLWDPRTNDGSLVKYIYTSHIGWVTSVAWSETNENLFISGSHDKVMKLWDLRSRKAPLYDMTGHENRIMCIDWSIHNLAISGGADNYIKLYSTSHM